LKRRLIIVAGGEGIRMGQKIPKQFIEIGGKPIIIWTMLLFYKCNISYPYILVLPETYFDYWNELCKKYTFTLPHKLVKGGKTRFHSVYNGLQEIQDECLVAIHDGVRPFVSINVIENAFTIAQIKGNCIPSQKLKDSVRKINNNNNKSFSRYSIRSIQTPQVFNSKIIKKAYDQQYSIDFTDDASVVEKAGYKINLIEGNEENIKITTPSDLIIAEAFIKYFPF